MDLDIDKVDKLKVVELRTALGEAGLDTKGTKPILVARLKSYLESKNGEDAAAEEAEAEKEPEAEVKEEAKPAEEGKYFKSTFSLSNFYFLMLFEFCFSLIQLTSIFLSIRNEF